MRRRERGQDDAVVDIPDAVCRCSDTVLRADRLCVDDVGIAAGSATGSSSSEGKGSFQVVSIDDRGLVNFWVALDIPGEEW